MPLGRTLPVHALALSLLLAAQPAWAATIVLDFEEEPLGYRDWGYVSLECSCVSFAYGSRPDEDEPASVYSSGYPTGKAFALLSDQTMSLTLSFLSVVDSVSLDFQAGRTDNS